MSWLGINIHNTYLHTKLIKIAFKSCYCSNKDREAKAQTRGKNSKFKKKTSKLKEITQNSRKKLNFSAFSESCDVKKVAKKKACYNKLSITSWKRGEQVIYTTKVCNEKLQRQLFSMQWRCIELKLSGYFRFRPKSGH